ncbi:MAG: cysteine desulfurase IscS [Acidimicrobiales bacterium]|nr:MAG: cysteine desulfurase IscS [Acidimicrobiales bacterium]
MHAYLDCAATTPVRPEVLEAMHVPLTECFANPSGAHALARRARALLDEARETIAGLLGVTPGEIIFTSGGTESDNLAITGAVHEHGGRPVCSNIEHHAVLEPVSAAGGVLVPVDRRGLVEPDVLARVLDGVGDVAVVSVMAVNNEIGVAQPIRELVEVTRRHAPGALFHVDAVQAWSWLDVTPLCEVVDLLSLSGHKFGAPKGTGILFVRKGVKIRPLLVGGGQERGLRSGTQNVAGAVAMAAAARAAVKERGSLVERVGAMRRWLARELTDRVPGVHETLAWAGCADVDRVDGILHLCIEGVEGEELLYLLERHEVYASVASSCSSGASRPSHVLDALGVPDELARGALRLSFGWCTSEAEVRHAAEVIPGVVEELRSRRRYVEAVLR